MKAGNLRAGSLVIVRLSSAFRTKSRLLGPSSVTSTGAFVPSLYAAGTYTKTFRSLRTDRRLVSVESSPRKILLSASAIVNVKFFPFGFPLSVKSGSVS